MAEQRGDGADPSAALRAAYVAHLPAAVREIGVLWQQAHEAPTEAASALDRLRALAQRIHGSSGTYGLHDLGDATARLDAGVQAFRTADDAGRPQAQEAVGVLLTQLQTLTERTYAATQLRHRPAPRPAPPEPEAKPPLVLVAEDVGLLRRRLLHTLKEAGFRVEEANNGQRAFDEVRRLQPDLLLLDVTLPVLDGFEVHHQLRRMEPFASLPILFLTPRHRVEEVRRALDKGPGDYLSKPIAEQEVIEKVQALVPLETRPTV